jgi:hypothetical protein
MGDLIFLAAYRADKTPAAAKPATGDSQSAQLALACGGMVAGVGRMQVASRLLTEAAAELRALAQDV